MRRGASLPWRWDVLVSMLDMAGLVSPPFFFGGNRTALYRPTPPPRVPHLTKSAGSGGTTKLGEHQHSYQERHTTLGTPNLAHFRASKYPQRADGAAVATEMA